MELDINIKDQKEEIIIWQKGRNDILLGISGLCINMTGSQLIEIYNKIDKHLEEGKKNAAYY